VHVPPSALLSKGSVTNDLPSALLNVAIPGNTTNSTGIILTCSIDARWAMGNYQGGPTRLIPWQYVQFAGVQSPNLFDADAIGDPSNHDDPSWRAVQIDIDWLEILTPALNNDITYTSFAAILTATTLASLVNTTNVEQFSHVIQSRVEFEVASLVANGIYVTSRFCGAWPRRSAILELAELPTRRTLRVDMETFHGWHVQTPSPYHRPVYHA